MAKLLAQFYGKALKPSYPILLTKSSGTRPRSMVTCKVHYNFNLQLLLLLLLFCFVVCFLFVFLHEMIATRK